MKVNLQCTYNAALNPCFPVADDDPVKHECKVSSNSASQFRYA